MAHAYDVVIIGAGPGGYVCAIRAAQLGLKVAVVEKRPTLGGTCLNVGCIPSKALLSVSEKFHEARHAFADFGITCRPKIDIAAMQAHKAAVVEANVKGIAYLFRKNGIDTWHGVASLVAPDRVRVSPPDAASEELRAEAVVIATGSETAALPGLDIDEKTILSSTGALELDRVPKSLAVIGAGVIGLELGSVWRRLGAEVTVIEYLDRILPGMDAEIATLARRELKKQGFDFRLGRKVTEAKRTRNGVVLTTVPANGEGEAETVRAARVLLAVGRRPFTRGLGLEEVGITLDEGGRIPVDENFQTAVPGIYAIGDVIAGPMLAHKAEEEGIAVAEILAGLPGEVDHDVIPAVVYVTPEIAAVGRTEEELAEAGVEYRKGVFRFMANGRARAMGQTAGMVKILADAGSDRVLGAHIAGPMAGELIHEIAVLMAFGGSAEDLARTCHAHPTLSEAVREAAMAAAFGRPVHA